MARRRGDVRERKCGCLYFEYGPPVLCPKHVAKHKQQEETTLRRAVAAALRDAGHSPTRWDEYESQRGKWTCYCLTCGRITIVYDTPPPVGDQICGYALQQDCDGSPRVSTGGSRHAAQQTA